MWRFGSAAICLLCSVLHFDEGLGRVGDELPEVHMNVVSTDVHSTVCFRWNISIVFMAQRLAYEEYL